MRGATLFQLHIPKTGGTTLFHALASRIPPQRVLLAVTGFVEPEELTARAGDVDLVAGHLTWAAVEAFPKPPAVLTVLRDPVEWAMSFHGYLRANAAAGIFEPRTQRLAEEAAACSMSDILLDRSSDFRRSVSSIQVAYLSSSRRNLRSYPSFITPDGDLDVPEAERALEIATRNLGTCAWVGVTETLDRDLRTLTARLGWRPFDRVERHLVTYGRAAADSLSLEARRELDRLVETDRTLHARARVLAHEAHAAIVDQLERAE